MSDALGDPSFLSRDEVPFAAVIEVKTASSHGSLSLVAARGLSQFLPAYASVRIVDNSLTASIFGPASSTTATTVALALVPSTVTTHPREARDILTIGGSAYLQSSAYTTPSSVPLLFPAEVNHQLKPTPVIGALPVLVYHVHVEGGDDHSVTLIQVRGKLKLSGVGFIPTW